MWQSADTHQHTQHLFQVSLCRQSCCPSLSDSDQDAILPIQFDVFLLICKGTANMKLIKGHLEETLAKVCQRVFIILKTKKPKTLGESVKHGKHPNDDF